MQPRLVDGKTYEASISITHEAAQIIGLDDMGRYPDLDRVMPTKRFIWCCGSLAAVQDLVNELYDRATEGGAGYDESPANKAICTRNVRRIIRLYGVKPQVHFKEVNL